MLRNSKQATYDHSMPGTASQSSFSTVLASSFATAVEACAASYIAPSARGPGVATFILVQLCHTSTPT